MAACGVVGDLAGGAGDGTWGAVHLGDIDFGWDIDVSEVYLHVKEKIKVALLSAQKEPNVT